METINFKNKKYEVIEKYKSNKLHVRYKDKNFIIVPFDTYNAYSVYLSNKKQLKKCKVEMSKVLKKDKKSLLVLEEYIKGESLINVIANGPLENNILYELFRVFRNNRFAKIALNYKPENFILRKKYLYYISDEVFNYKDVISFEKSEDLLLYMNTANQKRYIESKGIAYKEREIIKEGGALNKAIALLCVTYW